MQDCDLSAIKDIPGYEMILKTVLKTQIQQLVEQLADHTGEESVILTASVSDGSLSHLGSESGKVFLEDNEDIKSQFLGFCLKCYHQQNQLEDQQQTQSDLRETERPTLPDCDRFHPRPKSLFLPTESQASSKHDFTPQHSSPRQSHDHHRTFTKSSHGSENVRHEPYKKVKPHRSVLKQVPQQNTSVPVADQQIPDQDIVIIKVDNENSNEAISDTTCISDIGASDPNINTALVNSSESPLTKTVQPTYPISSVQNDASNNAVDNRYSEVLTGDKQGVDSSGVTGIDSECGIKSDQLISEVSENSKLQLDVTVKTEIPTESEVDLEITGVEPGNVNKIDSAWLSHIDNVINDAHSSSVESSETNRISWTREKMNPSLYELLEEDITKLMQESLLASPQEDKITEQEHSQPKWSKCQPTQVNIQPTQTTRQTIRMTSRQPQTILKQNQENRKKTKNNHWSKPRRKYAARCDMCGKFFRDSWLLKRHIVIHGSKPPRKNDGKCDVCGKFFRDNWQLKRHIVIHRSKPPGKNDGRCNVCGKIFRDNWQLKRHSITHQSRPLRENLRESCDVCGKSFQDKWQLKRHSTVHTGEKPYQCIICDKDFSRKEYLYKHDIKWHSFAKTE